MKHISLQSVDLSNFKSFSSAHIELRRGPGLRMIFGENRREPRLGANGAGKSTIWDAVCFCLSGRSVRGKRATDLVTTGHKSTAVSTAWVIDDDGPARVRTVRRTGPPERVYVDGELRAQADVDALMGLTRDRFLSSVLFGQAKPLFIDLPVPERGDLLDDVLGLGFWMRAADLATARWNAAGVEVQRLQMELARLDGALAELPSEADLSRAVSEYEESRRREVAELGDRRRAIDSEYRNLRRSMAAVRVDVNKREAFTAIDNTLRERLSSAVARAAVFQSEIDRLAVDIEFFEATGECPTCGQEIAEGFASGHLGDLARDRTAASDSLALVREEIATVRKLMGDVDDAIRDLGKKTDDFYRLGLAVADRKSQISTLNNRVQLLLGQANPHEAQLRTVSDRRADLGAQIAARRVDESALSARIGRLDFWRQGFRRVRVFCLARVLAELEMETMGAARSLGLAGWHIGFSGETENKSGTVRLGVQAVVQSPEARRDFDSWSPGEGQRVRCATALGLASLVQRYSGVSYDLEVWDEPSAWLSAEGIDDLFECLAERARARGKSIWVCDPRAGLSHGGFDEVWNVVKDEGGSRIEVARADSSAHLGESG